MDLIFAVGCTLVGAFFAAIGFNIFNPFKGNANFDLTNNRIRFYKLGGLFMFVVGIFKIIENL